MYVQINRLSLAIQVDYFNITRKQIDQLLGEKEARDYIMRKSIFSFTIGSNDFLNNYLLPVLSIGSRISQSPDSFIDDLITHLKAQLTVCHVIYTLKNIIDPSHIHVLYTYMVCACIRFQIHPI